ncbi:hypothetical protein [Chitinilyticum aquatile]|uniref:hypothetical protein n=1 Tax=Chitinilyticum aquatile TaxID=362520 RepID=UPI00048FCD5C|nr:hypothetical protein [Chitinilyticum aquatile]
MIYAMLKGNKVDNLIVADAATASLFVDVYKMWDGAVLADGKANAVIGATYNNVTKAFTAPQ